MRKPCVSLRKVEKLATSRFFGRGLPLKPASRIAGALNGMLSAASSISSAERHRDAYTLAKRVPPKVIKRLDPAAP
jgi:hypothetical protein